VYTHGHHDSVLRSHRWRTAENSAAYLLPHLRAGMSLLDVGCGPATLTFDLVGHRHGVTGWRRRQEPEVAMATALDHLVLVVSDIERALAWYGRHAGLAGVRVDEWRHGEAPFPSLRIDESTIIDLVPGRIGNDRGRLDHICFVVSPSELDRLASEPELEVVDSGERFGARGQGRSIYVRDPDGLLVEFRCYPG
jgi:catechol 2,3-dioxygenase-like lactoylglutathione lyase family enzyme